MAEDHSAVFREKLGGQAEYCARKSLELVQKGFHERTLKPEEIFQLASAAEIFLDIHNKYGKK